jgi:hypothetical protein
MDMGLELYNSHVENTMFLHEEALAFLWRKAIMNNHYFWTFVNATMYTHPPQE